MGSRVVGLGAFAVGGGFGKRPSEAHGESRIGPAFGRVQLGSREVTGGDGREGEVVHRREAYPACKHVSIETPNGPGHSGSCQARNKEGGRVGINSDSRSSIAGFRYFC